MTGQNKIFFNEATMKEIVQYWLDNKLLNPNEPRPKVIGFDKETKSYSGDSYEVILESADEKAK